MTVIVYQVLHNTVTSGSYMGRDDGYPTTVLVGPLFETEADAQREIDEYWSNHDKKPGAYEVHKIVALSPRQASKRRKDRRDKAAALLQERADRARAEAERLEREAAEVKRNARIEEK